MAQLTLDEFVIILNTEPTQQCVVFEDLFDDYDFTPQQAAEASNRVVKPAIDFQKMKNASGIVLRCNVFVFSPKGEF